MGIRLSMQTVFGIDDLRVEKRAIVDPRYVKAHEWEEDDTIPPPSIDDLPEDTEERGCILSQKPWVLRRYLLHRTISVSAMHEVLYFDPEFGHSNIIGVPVGDRLYGHDVFRGLLSLDTRYHHNGHEVIPSLRPEGDSSIGAMGLRIMNQYHRHSVKLPKQGAMLQAANAKKRMLKHGWNYGAYFDVEIESWLDQVRYVFDYIGLHVNQRDLKLMLVWNWS